jgi:hypothetical protein
MRRSRMSHLFSTASPHKTALATVEQPEPEFYQNGSKETLNGNFMNIEYIRFFYDVAVY